MTSTPQQPDDVDPTGVRELLAGLPDPGPMPEDLVRRIEARLAVERAHLAAGTDEDAPAVIRTHVAHADQVVDLAAERSRRRPARTLGLVGAAAAGLVVTTMAITQLTGGPGGGLADTAAVYPSRAGSGMSKVAEDGAGEGGGAAAAPEGVDDASQPQAGAPAAADAEATTAPTLDDLQSADSGSDGVGLDALRQRAQVVPSLGRVAETDLATRLHEVMAGDDQQLELTEEQAVSCWRRLAQTHTFAHYVAAPASWADTQSDVEPVVVLLGGPGDGSGQAWVLPATCTTDPEAAPLLGPLPVGAP